jgi:hypothetical protein
MIRKLTLAVTLAATFVAMLAALAPVANADQEFYVTDQDYNLCSWEGGWDNGCVDTGYEGEMDFVNALGVAFNNCDASFDLNIDQWGGLNLERLDIVNCGDTSWGKQPFAEPCGYRSGYPQYPAAAYNPGQLTWPDNAPPTGVELEIPFCYGIGFNDYVSRVVFNPSVGGTGLRTITQVSAPETYLTNVDDAVFEDTNSSDNVRVILGTP